MALSLPQWRKKSDRQIAEHVGVSHDMVRRYREELEPSSIICKIATRTVTRNGTTYEQNTTNIGKGVKVWPRGLTLKSQRSRDEVGKMFGVSGRQIQRAGRKNR